MATTAVPTLTLQARKAGGILLALGLDDEAQFLAHFGRAVATGCTPVTATMLERADALIGLADAVAANDAAAEAAA